MSESSPNRNHSVPPAINDLVKRVSEYTVETRYDRVTMDHIMYVLMKENDYVKKIMDEAGPESSVKIAELVDHHVRAQSPSVNLETHRIRYDTNVITMLSVVPIDVSSQGRNTKDIKWVDIFHAVIKDHADGSVIEEIFKKNPEYKTQLLNVIEKKAQGSELDQHGYVVNYSKLAADGKLDPVIGREMEIQDMTEILARKKKNNIMLLGDPGVGKTAVVEGIAMAIHKGKCHETLSSKRIYGLDVAGLLAGTKFRGEFEERAQEILTQLCEDGDAIVFIDEAHTAMGAGASTQGGVDLANIMKPLLARGELMCIAATTYDEYKQTIQKDKAMVRRFQNYTVNEPDEQATIMILEKLMPLYEKFHGVTYDNIIDSLMKNCQRYIQNRAFPDKAIDILDASGAYSKINGLPTVTEDVITKIVSRISNVPEQALKKSDTDVFEHLGDEIKKNLFGQDHVVDKIVEEVLISKSGMVQNNKPIGSFLLSGTSGVGKTELCRQLADRLNIPLIKYDMSEFQEQHSVAKLIGAPPGYVGYDENSAKLIDDIENHPNCVLLLDEIEKAHPQVLSIFLQVMDDGKLTSSNGKSVKFNNVIILMTTNLGAKEKNAGNIGFTKTNATSNTADTKAVENFFKPEFLNRLSVGHAISFNNLTQSDMTRIVDKELAELNAQMVDSKVRIDMSDAAKQHLADEGYDPAMGARPLQRVIKDYIKKPLSKELVFGRLKEGGVVKVDMKEGEIAFTFSKI